MTIQRKSRLLAVALCATLAAAVHAQPAQPVQVAPGNGANSSGTTVIIPAYGEVRQTNDEAVAVLMIEEQDRDKSAAASRVNQKMKQGTEIVKREDPGAVLRTRGYYTYPVYQEEPPKPAGARTRQIIGWRAGQYLEVITRNLDGLPKTVAAAQRILQLNGLQFRLSEPATKKLDQARIDAAYRNLTDRVAAVAKAMGRNPADAVLETIDFEGSGNYAPQAEAAQAMSMRAKGMQDAANVEEPSFEPGETALQMRVVGRVKFR